jgi:hypothetical protein
MGADIDSACGQLVVLSKDMAGQEDTQSRTVVCDIEDGLSGDKSISTSSNKKSVIKESSQSVRMATVAAVATAATGPRRQGASNAKDDDPLMDLEKWILPLQIATTIAASCFLMSAAVYLKQRRR